MNIPSRKSLIIVKLTPFGFRKFNYPSETIQRELYFIDDIEKGCLTQWTILIGQFLFKLESLPKETLRFIPGLTNRSYFPESTSRLIPGCVERLYFPEDTRIISYEIPTPKEVVKFFKRMNQLSQKHSAYSERIKEILDSLVIK